MDKQTNKKSNNLILLFVFAVNKLVKQRSQNILNRYQNWEETLFFMMDHFHFFFTYIFFVLAVRDFMFCLRFHFPFCNEKANWEYEKEIIRKLIYQLLVLSQQIDRVSLTIYYRWLFDDSYHHHYLGCPLYRLIILFYL